MNPIGLFNLVVRPHPFWGWLALISLSILVGVAFALAL